MIDNLLRMARLNKLFDPSQMSSEPIMNPDNPMDSPNYQDAAYTRMNDLLAGMPVHQNPGVLDKIGAMMTGIAHGPEAENKFLNRKNDKAMAEWRSKFDPTVNAANVEGRGNAQERLLAAQRETERKNRAAEEAKNRQLTETERKNQADEAIRKVRTGVYEWKAKNPNHIMKADENGYLISFDPVSQRIQFVTDDLGNKIKSDRLPDADRINLQIQGQKEVAAVKGAETRKTKSTSGTSSTSPNQIKIDQYNKARQYYNEHPEAQKYIQLGEPGTNDFKLSGPQDPNWIGKALGQTGFSQEAYDAAKKFIYGDAVPIVEEKVTKPPVKDSKLAPPVGEKVLYKNGKKIGTIRNTPGQLAAAKKKGYEVKDK